jgi:hypothetical protein
MRARATRRTLEMAKRLGFRVLMLAVLLGWSGPALAQDAKVYELTENMKLIAKGKTDRRKATSEIMGFVQPGTAICPAYLAEDVAGRGKVCTLNITASDNIRLTTGLGTLQGRYTVVVQGDDPKSLTDSPEFVVSRGDFRGKMDFSPAILGQIPYGTVVGTLDPDGRGHHEKVGFTGTFYLPFTLADGNAYYLDFNPANQFGVVPVADNERALGYATVKFEIKFQ